MFYEGQRVTLKSVSDMIDEGILFQDGLEFGRVGDVSPMLEGALIRRENYALSVILLNNEVKYLGQMGEVVIYSPEEPIFNWDGTELLAEPERPIALQMDDGYVIRLVPEFLVVPKDRYYGIIEEGVLESYERIIEQLINENDELRADAEKTKAKIIELKRKLALAELRR